MNSVAWLNLPHKVPDKLKVGTLFGSNVNTSHICITGCLKDEFQILSLSEFMTWDPPFLH